MKDSPVILAIQYGGHDTSAALMKGGVLVAACEEERYNRDKHTRDFPVNAIEDCFKIGGVSFEDVDEIAFCCDVMYYIRETYLRKALEDTSRIGFLIQDIDRIKNFYEMESFIREQTGFQGHIEFHRHHLCHLASSYYPSGFSSSFLASYDGMGEIETALLATGEDGAINIVDESNHYPHSLGLLYSAVTHFLGFKHHCDEGIIMGLACYGDHNAIVPGSTRSYYSFFEEILEEISRFSFQVNTDWIAYHQVRDVWISEKFCQVFGPKKEWEDEITPHHQHIAAALQKRVEDVVLNQLRHARKEYDFDKLCLAGGVALNCSMNGKIEASGIFDEIFVQPASGDNGTVIGACYLSHQRLTGDLKPSKSHNSYLGSRFDNESILKALEKSELNFTKADNIFEVTAAKLAEKKIVAWFQGAAEFGPRALGNRSILTRPYPEDMKDYLNARVKFREGFRPFAPAVLSEHAQEYFTIQQHSPHMLIACQATQEKASSIPAVVHVDNSCRVQTVSEESNPCFRKLLERFYELTGCPVVLNTSFNVKGQPIVNSPEQAIECFTSTNIDFLALGDYYIDK